MAEDKVMEPVDEGMAVVPDAPLADAPTIIPELEGTVSQLATDVSFARKTWKDGSSGGTPITAAELNRLEKGVTDLTTAVNGLRDSVSRYRTLWGTTLTIPINKNQLGILLCSSHIGAIMVSGKNVYIDKSLGVTVSVSVSGDNATLSVDTEMSLMALMMPNQPSVGRTVSVDVGDVLIGDQGYFQLFTVPAFMTAIGGSVENIIRIDLETYSSVTPVSPFSILNYWVIGQANTTVSGLRLRVWVKPQGPSVGQPIVVEIGDAFIGDQGFFSFATVPAFMSAVGGSLGNVVRIDLSTYDNVKPVTPFSVFKYWLIGQPGSTVSGLKVTVWSRA